MQRELSDPIPIPTSQSQQIPCTSSAFVIACARASALLSTPSDARDRSLTSRPAWTCTTRTSQPPWQTPRRTWGHRCHCTASSDDEHERHEHHAVQRALTTRVESGYRRPPVHERHQNLQTRGWCVSARAHPNRCKRHDTCGRHTAKALGLGRAPQISREARKTAKTWCITPCSRFSECLPQHGH